MHGLLEHPAQVLGRYACQLRKHGHGEILAVIIVNIVQHRHEQAASVLALFRGFGSVVKFKYILIYQPGTDVIAVYLIRFLLNEHLIVKVAQTFGAFGTDNAGLCHFQLFEQSIAESQIGREAYGGVYCHNDMDMLVVGMHGGGDYAVGMFNFSDKKSEMSLQFYDIGLPAASGRGLELYDCYSHSVIGTFSERYAAQIESHDCLMFRAKVVKL